MRIGLIGGIGPAATEFYYRNLVRVFAAAGHRLELTMVHADVGQLVANIGANAAADQTRVYLDFARSLQAGGADVVVISSIAGHFCLPEFEPLSPLPIVSILPALDAEFRARKLKRVGLLGSRVTMESRLFSGISSAEVLIPEGEQLDWVDREYMNMAVAGSVTGQQREQMFKVGRELCNQQAAEAVLLGGTDLFLAFAGQDCGFTVIDGALVHIAELLRRSIEFDAH